MALDAAGAANDLPPVSPRRRVRDKADFESGKYDFAQLGRQAQAVHALYERGEDGVEVSDHVACASSADGEAALVLCVTPHTLYLLYDGTWKVHTQVALRDLERVLFDPDGRSLIVSDGAASVVLRVRCSEGTRRYHLHSQLRSLYHSEAFKPLPSLVGPCDLQRAERRRGLLARIETALAQMSADVETGAFKARRLEADAAAAESQDEEIALLEQLAADVEAAAAQSRRGGAARAGGDAEVWGEVRGMEEKVKLLDEQLWMAREEAVNLEAELVAKEAEQSKLRGEMERLRFGEKQNDISQEWRERIHLATAEVLARKQLVSGYKLHLAGLALAKEREWSQLLVRQVDADLRALASGVQWEQQRLARNRTRGSSAAATATPTVGWPSASRASPSSPPAQRTPQQSHAHRATGSSVTPPHLGGAGGTPGSRMVGAPLSPARPAQPVVVRHTVSIQDLLAQSVQNAMGDARVSPAISSQTVRRSASLGGTSAASPLVRSPPSRHVGGPDPRLAEQTMRQWRDLLKRHTGDTASPRAGSRTRARVVFDDDGDDEV